ncbi:siderophore-interacting protein [Pseudoclavibacter sp. AY1F1]|uniref:siderophore-interacting protein n=1 Tax=Pseudoclavibacter sp. AY1F1 TaxID=2080583 RepID=UPI0015E3AB4A|nr:siderophore-interacting protein [Pseudoclavibacter sp. AY1F1]
MSNISTTHASSGLIRSRLVARERVSEHEVRVTLEGDDLVRFHGLGFDQWFRFPLPPQDDSVFDSMPDRIDFKGYLKYLLISQAKRPAMHNSTVREFRAHSRQLDIDVLPREARGHAVIEIPTSGDTQPVDTPADFSVDWVTRTADKRPGELALEHARAIKLGGALGGANPYAFAVGLQCVTPRDPLARIHLHLRARSVIPLTSRAERREAVQ